MGNRKLPFGYRMEMGQEGIFPEEAQIVRKIFDCYLAGESFSLLAQKLECQSIPYGTGKPWNKNTVARILEDSRYAGTRGFPAIVDLAYFHAAVNRRKGQQRSVRRTETEKVLRQLSGRLPTAQMTSQVLFILNMLISNEEAIKEPPLPSKVDSVICRRELERLLTQPPVDEDAANDLVRRSAILCYQAIGSGKYETERLKRIFSTTKPADQLDAELLRSTVAFVIVERNTVVGIQLKNGQLIKRSDLA